eukprot:1028670_1
MDENRITFKNIMQRIGYIISDETIEHFFNPPSTRNKTTTDKDDSEYWMEQITQRMHDIDRQILVVQILKQRHKNYDMVKEDTHIHELYHYNNTAASTSRRRSILLCVACATKMERTKCPDTRSEIECYECNILISQLSMEYWHCPNVQLSEHGVIGRDLCCVCGIK